MQIRFGSVLCVHSTICHLIASVLLHRSNSVVNFIGMTHIRHLHKFTEKWMNYSSFSASNNKNTHTKKNLTIEKRSFYCDQLNYDIHKHYAITILNLSDELMRCTSMCAHHSMVWNAMKKYSNDVCKSSWSMVSNRMMWIDVF